MTEASSSFAQRARQRIHFDHDDMDYYLAWVLGREIYGGSERQECLATAARIRDGDPGSWQVEWVRLAQQLEVEAEEAAAAGRSQVAGEMYLRACTYHRAGMFIMEPKDPAFRPAAESMRRCFLQANPLGQARLKQVELDYEGVKLPGYYGQVGSADEPAPLLIVVGGIETFIEDCYFMIGPTVMEGGFNFLTVDLPGQGFTPYDGLHFGARMEKPMRAVLDFALELPEVDQERLAIYGFSWGGHIVFKSAYHDARVKAMIANPPMPNVFRAALAQQGGHDRTDPIAKTVFQQIAWRMGLKISFNPVDIARRFGKAYDYLFHGKVKIGEIRQPTLCLAGEAEPPITLEIAEECRDQLPHPQSKVLILSQEDGSEAHCQVDNLMAGNRRIFDWLAELGW